MLLLQHCVSEHGSFEKKPLGLLRLRGEGECAAALGQSSAGVGVL
jgi:hypothetical protein